MDTKFDLGITVQQAMAALAGSMIQIAIFPPKSKAWAVVMIISGSLAAAYLSPLVIHLLHRWLNVAGTPGPMENAIVFLTGAFGMMVLSIIGKGVEKVRENPWVLMDLWKSWRNGGGGGATPPAAR